MAVDFGLLGGRSFASDAARGLQIAGAMEDREFQRSEREREKRERERTEQLMQSLQAQMSNPEFQIASSTDFQELAALRPDIARTQAAGFEQLSKKRQEEYVADMIKARDAMASGNFESAVGILGDRIARVTEAGGNPSDSIRAFQIAQTNPEYFVQGVDNMIQARTGRDLADGTIREPKVGRFRTIDAGDRIDVMDSATSQIVRSIPKGATAKQEADAEKRELENEARRSEVRNKVYSEQDALNMAMEAQGVAQSLLDAENLDDVVGTFDAITPVIRKGSQELLNTAKRLTSMLTADNLAMMSGPLTDNDILFLSRIASGLEVTDRGIKGSEAGVRRRLSDIIDRINEKTGGKQNEIDNKLFIGKRSSILGRPITASDVQFARDKGYSTREIYQALGVQDDDD